MLHNITTSGLKLKTKVCVCTYNYTRIDFIRQQTQTEIQLLCLGPLYTN